MSTLPGTTGRRRLYLMRHGHVDYLAPTVTDSVTARKVALTPRGRLQAEAAGRALAHVTIDRALCSGLPRTEETAKLVLSCLGSAPALEADPDFVEIHIGRIKMSSMTAMTFLFGNAPEPDATIGEGGEPFVEAQQRTVRGLKRLLAEPGWRQTLVVAHEGINRILLSWAAGADLAAVPAFEQDTGCINVIDFDMVPAEDGSPSPEIARAIIKAVNLTPYNYVKHGMNLTSLEAILQPGAVDREP